MAGWLPPFLPYCLIRTLGLLQYEVRYQGDRRGERKEGKKGRKGPQNTCEDEN